MLQKRIFKDYKGVQSIWFANTRNMYTSFEFRNFFDLLHLELLVGREAMHGVKFEHRAKNWSRNLTSVCGNQFLTRFLGKISIAYVNFQFANCWVQITHTTSHRESFDWKHAITKVLFFKLKLSSNLLQFPRKRVVLPNSSVICHSHDASKLSSRSHLRFVHTSRCSVFKNFGGKRSKTEIRRSIKVNQA